LTTLTDVIVEEAKTMKKPLVLQCFFCFFMIKEGVLDLGVRFATPLEPPLRAVAIARLKRALRHPV